MFKTSGKLIREFVFLKFSGNNRGVCFITKYDQLLRGLDCHLT